MVDAVEEFRKNLAENGNPSYRKIASQFGVPHITLYKKIAGKTPMKRAMGPKPKLGSSFEQSVVKCLFTVLGSENKRYDNKQKHPCFLLLSYLFLFSGLSVISSKDHREHVEFHKKKQQQKDLKRIQREIDQLKKAASKKHKQKKKKRRTVNVHTSDSSSSGSSWSP